MYAGISSFVGSAYQRGSPDGEKGSHQSSQGVGAAAVVGMAVWGEGVGGSCAEPSCALRLIAPDSGEEGMVTKKPPKHEHASPRVATLASKILRDPKSPKAQRSVAATALTQTRNKKSK